MSIGAIVKAVLSDPISELHHLGVPILGDDPRRDALELEFAQNLRVDPILFMGLGSTPATSACRYCGSFGTGRCDSCGGPR